MKPKLTSKVVSKNKTTIMTTSNLSYIASREAKQMVTNLLIGLVLDRGGVVT